MATYSQEETVKIATRVTWVGFWVNAALSGLKILAGIVGRSGAMLADGVHSLSDFVTDLIVVVMIRISRKKENELYQYGHGKYETMAVLLISVLLGVVAIGLFVDGLSRVIEALNGEILPRPGMIALWMALISIAAKEGLFHYTRMWGRRIGSTAVEANAWHHRSDALSSIATLVGIAGAIFLGDKWRVLDPIAAMAVSVFILLVAWQLGRPAVSELLERSLPSQMTAPMREIVRTTPGVKAYHHFRSRRNGYKIIVDLHIKVDPGISLIEGHRIATDVENRLRAEFGADMVVNIHVEPYAQQIVCEDGSCED